MATVQGKNYRVAVSSLVCLLFVMAGQGRADSPLSAPLFICGSSTINTVDALGAIGAYASLVIGTDGFPVIAYNGYDTGKLNVAKCGDAACNSVTINTLDAVGDVGLWNSITIGTDGFPIISYHDFGSQDLKVAKCGDAACTPTLTTIQILDSNGSVGRYTSIKIGTDGLPVVSYHDLDNFNLKVAKCGDDACTPVLATFNTPDTTRNTGADTALAIGADGFPVISHFFSFGTGSALRVTKCRDDACTPGLAISHDLDSTGYVGRGNAIAIGTDGFPVISYEDHTNKDLKLAKCGDSSCTPALVIVRTLDSMGDVGGVTSIAIGSDGFPVIAYSDDTNWDLKLAQCGDPSCLPALVRFWTPDTAGDVGVRPSLAIGTDGFPVIAYSDSTNKTLKVAKCGPVRLFNPMILR